MSGNRWYNQMMSPCLPHPSVWTDGRHCHRPDRPHGRSRLSASRSSMRCVRSTACCRKHLPPLQAARLKSAVCRRPYPSPYICWMNPVSGYGSDPAHPSTCCLLYPWQNIFSYRHRQSGSNSLYFRSSLPSWSGGSSDGSLCRNRYLPPVHCC